MKVPFIQAREKKKKYFLKVHRIYKSFGEPPIKQEVLKDVSFELFTGEICVLLGPSGSGKSTLLNILGGIIPADSGEIDINGIRLDHLNEKSLREYRRRHLGYVFQAYNLISNLTVKENIEVGAYLSNHALNTDKLMEILGLYQHRHKLPRQLSGGEQQRVSIGRAVVKNPDLLLCDEPTGSLDYKSSKETLTLLEEINQRYKTNILIVTHNEAIRQMGDRILRLREGKIDQNLLNHRVFIKDLEW